MKEKRQSIEPKINDEFLWEGVKLKCVPCTGNGCARCFFNRYQDERKSKGCVDHICEAMFRVDDECVKFIKIK